MMFLTVKVVDTSNESCSIGKRSEAAPLYCLNADM